MNTLRPLLAALLSVLALIALTGCGTSTSNTTTSTADQAGTGGLPTAQQAREYQRHLSGASSLSLVR